MIVIENSEHYRQLESNVSYIQPCPLFATKNARGRLHTVRNTRVTARWILSGELMDPHRDAGR